MSLPDDRHLLCFLPQEQFAPRLRVRSPCGPGHIAHFYLLAMLSLVNLATMMEDTEDDEDEEDEGCHDTQDDVEKTIVVIRRVWKTTMVIKYKYIISNM